MSAAPVDLDAKFEKLSKDVRVILKSMKKSSDLKSLDAQAPAPAIIPPKTKKTSKKAPAPPPVPASEAPVKRGRGRPRKTPAL